MLEPENGNYNNVPPFEHYWRADVWMLRCFGLTTMENIFTNRIGFPNWWAVGVTSFCMISISIAAITQTVTVFNFIKTDLIFAMHTTISTCPTLLCIIKGTQLWFYRNNLKKLIQRLDELWEDARKFKKINTDIEKHVKRSALIRDYYIKMMGLTLITYSTRPYISLLKHQLKHHNNNESFDFSATLYGSTYPFPKDSYIAYFSCLFFEQYIVLILYLLWSSCTTLFAQLTTHACIHFQILANDIMDVTENSLIEKDRAELLAAIVNRHNQLFMYCDLIAKIYNPITLFTVLVSSLNFCSCIYCISQGAAGGNWGNVARDTSHAFSLAFQTALYCGQGEWVTKQSALVSYTVYHSHWMNFGKQSKIILLMILIRAQNEVKVAAYGIIYLTFTQLTNIAKMAFSIFTLLRNFS